MNLVAQGLKPEILSLLQKHEKYLQAERPDQSAGQDPSILALTCIDSRMQIEKILGLEPGEAMVTRNVGGVWQGANLDDPSAKAWLNYPLTNLHPKVVLIAGHNHCGGMQGLVDSVLKGVASETSDVAHWLLPLAEGELSHKIRETKASGATPEQIQQVVEYMMPPISAQRMMDSELVINGEKRKAGDLLREKNIPIVPVVYNLERRELDMYHPGRRQYLPLREVLAERLNPPSEISVSTPKATQPAPLPLISTQDIRHGMLAGYNELKLLADQSVART